MTKLRVAFRNFANAPKHSAIITTYTFTRVPRVLKRIKVSETYTR